MSRVVTSLCASIGLGVWIGFVASSKHSWWGWILHMALVAAAALAVSINAEKGVKAERGRRW